MVEVTPSPGPVHDGFAGHLGHLTQPQQASLETFRGNLTLAGLYTPASSDGTAIASCDDVTLLCVPFLPCFSSKFLPMILNVGGSSAPEASHPPTPKPNSQLPNNGGKTMMSIDYTPLLTLMSLRRRRGSIRDGRVGGIKCVLFPFFA